MSQQINLYSPLFRKQKKLFTAVTMLQGLALVAVGLVAVYVLAFLQVRTLERQAAEFQRRLNVAMEQLKAAGAAAPKPGDEKALEARAAQLEAELAANRQIMEMIAPQDPSRSYVEPLRALARRRVEGVWLTSVTLSGEAGDLSLTGRALNADLVPRYIERLSGDAAMRGRRFATLDITREQATPAQAKAPAAKAGEGIVFRLAAPGAEEGS